MGNLERFVLKTPLNFDKVIKDAVEISENLNKEIIVVGRNAQYPTYLKIRRSIKELNPKIKISYKRDRPKLDLPYNKGPYFIEINCFEFE